MRYPFLAVGLIILLAVPPLTASAQEGDWLARGIHASDVAPTSQRAMIAMGFDEFIVAFTELPATRETWGKFPVRAVDESLGFLIVRTTDPDALAAHALTEADVRYVEWNDPLYARPSFVPNDPQYGNAGHWGSKRIGAEVAWDKTLGSTAVTIAVIDTGLNKNHEEFAGRSRVLSGWDFVDNDNDPEDTGMFACNWHGTHVTGTLGATINNGKGIAGLAQVNILPIKIFGAKPKLFGIVENPGCVGSTLDSATTFRYAADQGARISQNSWQGGQSSAVTDAIAYAHDKGVIHVAAAGNDGPCTNCVAEPWRSNAARVIIVSASNAENGFATRFSGSTQGSSEGPEVTLIAPGDQILSSTSATSGYASMSGTSMAAPHVTGTIALMLSVAPTLDFGQVRDHLTSNAQDLGLPHSRQGAGLVRVNLTLPDTSAPVVLSHTVSGTSFTTDETLTVNFDVLDEGGITFIGFAFRATDGSFNFVQANFEPGGSGVASGHYPATYTWQGDDYPGAYELYQIITQDEYGNTRYDWWPTTGPTQLTFEPAEYVDTTAPEVTSHSFSGASFTTGETLMVDFDVIDESRITFIGFAFRTTNGTFYSVQANFEPGGSGVAPGHYAATYTWQGNERSGGYALYQIITQDEHGNTRYLWWPSTGPTSMAFSP